MIAKSLRAVPPLTPSVPTRGLRLRGGARVVIVDDRSTARKLLEGLALALEPGVVVDSFDDPHDALEQMRLVTPDLIITDYRMPGMDGIEFTRRIRAERHLADVPVSRSHGLFTTLRQLLALPGQRITAPEVADLLAKLATIDPVLKSAVNALPRSN